MAIIICTECGHPVSEKASKCPHCGCPVEDILEARNKQAREEEAERRRKAREEEQQKDEELRRAQRELEARRKAQRKQAREQRRQSKDYRIWKTVLIVVLCIVAALALAQGGYYVYRTYFYNPQSLVDQTKARLSKDHIILGELVSSDCQKIVYTDLRPGTADYEPSVHVMDLRTQTTYHVAIDPVEGLPASDYIKSYKIIGNRLCLIASTDNDYKPYIWRDQFYFVDLDDYSLHCVDYGLQAGFDQDNGVYVSKQLSEKDSTGKIHEYTRFHTVTYDMGAQMGVLKTVMETEAPYNRIIEEVYNKHYVAPTWLKGKWFVDIVNAAGERVAEQCIEFEGDFYTMYIDDQMSLHNRYYYCDSCVTLKGWNYALFLNLKQETMKDSYGKLLDRAGKGAVVHPKPVAAEKVRFHNEGDVVRYLAKHVFVGDRGMQIQITGEGLFINGQRATNAPRVLNVDTAMALIKVSRETGSNEGWSFLIDAIHGRIWDENRNFYYAQTMKFEEQPVAPANEKKVAAKPSAANTSSKPSNDPQHIPQL